MHEVEKWLMNEFSEIYSSLNDSARREALQAEMLSELSLNETPRYDVSFPHVVSSFVGFLGVPLKTLGSIGSASAMFRVLENANSADPLETENFEEAQALTEVALDFFVNSVKPLSRANMEARVSERIRIAGNRLEYEKRVKELTVKLREIETDEALDAAERRRLRSLVKDHREFFESLLANNSKISEKVGDFFRYLSVRVGNFFSRNSDTPGAALNDDGICALNAVVLAILNLQRLPQLFLTDHPISKAFRGMGEASANGKVFEIECLREALGPGYSRIYGDQFGAVPSIFLEHLANEWPALGDRCRGGGWLSRRPSVRSLIKIKSGTLQDLLRLNSFRISNPPEILIFEIQKFPLKLETELILDYPQVLRVGGKIDYRLRATVEEIPGHVYTVIWRENGTCVKLDNGLRENIAAKASGKTELLFYEAPEGYVSETSVSLLDLLPPAKKMFGALLAILIATWVITGNRKR